MENYKIKGNAVSIVKIELNDQGDYVAVSTDDSALFDRFTAGYKRIAELADEAPVKLEEIEKRYEGRDDFSVLMEKAQAVSQVNMNFSKEAVSVMDGIFGEGTIRKYFRIIYEEIPDFLPDAECFIAFLEEITPVMEKLFGRKMESRRENSRARMAKYQPQDHKKTEKG